MAKSPTSVCIPKEFVEDVKKLNLQALNSVDRINALRSVVGDSAEDIALIYEKSLTLRNQTNAIDRFIANIDGVSLERKAIIKEQIFKRLETKRDIISDKELSTIIRETLNNKYGLEVPIEDVAKIATLKKEASELSKTATGTADGSNEKLLWGMKLAEANKIVEASVVKDMGPLGSLKMSGRNIKSAFKEDFFGGIGTTLSETARQIFAPGLKGIKASLDASGLSRQGLKVLVTNPRVWVKMVGNNWKSWAKVGSKEAMDKVRMSFEADMLTRDLYQDAIKSGLAVNIAEDFFPNSAVSEIKGLGNFFQASDDAYTLSMQGARMDIFEKYVNAYKFGNDGKMPDSTIMKGFARVANSLTGRGGLGKLESFSGNLNKIFFSARYQTAQINTFRHAFDMSLPKEARREAQYNLAKIFGIYAGVMQGFSLAGGEVGWNPKEGTFGKVKMPGSKKWVDLTGGTAQYLGLPFKVLSKTGKQPFGVKSAFEVLVGFASGKLAPAPGVVRDFLSGTDFQGKEPTTWSSLKNLFVPITVDNVIQDFKKQEELDILMYSFILEFIGTSISNPKPKDIGRSPIDIISGN